jgi:amino acid adenylation domain-containing protein
VINLSKELSSLSLEQRELLKALLEAEGVDASRLPISARNKDLKAIPLSFAQRRLWLLNQIDPDDPSYVMAASVEMEGELKSEQLWESLKEIMRRHEALRTTFSSSDGQPVQMIHEEMEISMPMVDLSWVAPVLVGREVERVATQEAQERFDLVKGPLIRGKLLKIGEQKHVLLLSMHHIVSDGWSVGVLIKEAGEIYGAKNEGREARLEMLEIQYADYAVWQREWLTGKVLEEQVGYWKEVLNGAPAVLDIATDRGRPAVTSYQGASHEIQVRKEVKEGLVELSRQHGATLYMTLMGAYKVLLYRYSGQQDIVVGTPIANRNRRELEGLIGFFVNTLVMRTKLEGEESFREVIRREKEAALGAYEHKDVPFEKLVEEIRPERGLSHMPLFQVWFVYHGVSAAAIDLPGLTIRQMKVDRGVAMFDLTLSIEDLPHGLTAVIEYSTDLFDTTTVKRMLAHLNGLLESTVGSPDQPISRLGMLAQQEQQQLLVDWNDMGSEYPRTGIHHLFERQVETAADSIAVQLDDRQLSYREANKRANQLARYIKGTLGVGQGTLVGMCVDRSVDMIPGLIAILKAGGVYVPLDPSYPEERIAFMLQDSELQVLITQQELLSRLPVYAAALEIACLDSDWQAIANESSEDLDGNFQPDDLAYIIYTSGSAGAPKGVCITHEAAAGHFAVIKEEFGLLADDRVLQFASLNFDVSLEEIFPTLMAGARLVLKGNELWTATELFDRISLSGLTVVNPPTPYWHQITKQSRFWLKVNTSPWLRLVIVGGDAMLPEAVRLWHKAVARPIRLLNAYGPTEAVVVSSVYDVQPECCDDTSVRRLPIGRPLANRQMYVVGRDECIEPIGLPGELHIGGMLLATGYLNRPEITAEKFVPDPFSGHAGVRLYKTGDLVRFLGNGEIEFLRRVDDQAKVRGYRIELGEVEAVIGQHPAVKESAVLAREDVSGERRLIAYIAAVEQRDLTSRELRRFLRQKVPDYMIPSRIVLLDGLPLTANGKIDRQALATMGPTEPEREVRIELPRNSTEETLAKIWAETLGISQISIHDNFFEIGGDSLLATQVTSRVQESLNADMQVRSIFETPTLAGLAEHLTCLIEDSGPRKYAPISPVERSGGLPLSFAQQRLWYLDQFDPQGVSYNLTTSVEIEGELSVEGLQDCFNEIISRHESLRTTFSMQDNQPVQIIHCRMPLSLALVDLTSLGEAQLRREVPCLSQQEAQQRFDLTSGPLIRAKLMALRRQRHVLLLSMHHIVSDGWSVRVLLNEMAQAYETKGQGLPLMLEELPIQYADYAVWQRKWLEGEVIEEQLSYWKETLKGAPSLLELPTDRIRPAVASRRGGCEEVSISRPLKQGLEEISRREGATLFIVMMAGYKALLYRYTGEPDIAVGTPIANRNRAEIAGLIGFFVNTLVMRTKIEAEMTFRDLVKREKEVALGAYAHQDLPFEKLVQELRPERNLSYTPLFQVNFTLRSSNAEELKLGGVNLNAMPVSNGMSNFDLILELIETEEDLKGVMEYSTDLFDSATILRMLENFKSLLQGVVAEPGVALLDIPMTSDSRQRFSNCRSEHRSPFEDDQFAF